MEFVCIEAKTFEDMRMALELLKKKVEMLSQRHLPKRLDKWLDNQEVCAILHIRKYAPYCISRHEPCNLCVATVLCLTPRLTAGPIIRSRML